MNFESAPPSVVRSVKQRDLLNVWLRLYDHDAQPSIAAYAPDRLGEERRDLVYYKVFATETGPRIMINSEGSRLAQSYGRVNSGNKGTWLDEYLGSDLRPLVLPIYAECIRRRLPVYTIFKVEDVRGQTVDYERLVLPFFADGVVDDIIMSAKLISEASRFALDNLFRIQDKPPVPIVRVVIDPELTTSSGHRQRTTNDAGAPVDIVEI